MKNGCIIEVMSVVGRINARKSGYFRRVLEIDSMLSEEGYETIIVAPWLSKIKKVELVNDTKVLHIPPLTIPKVYIPFWDDFISYPLPLLITLFILCLFKRIKGIHSHNPPDTATFVSILIGKIFRIPVIYDIHDFWIDLWKVSKYKWSTKRTRVFFATLIEKMCLFWSSAILVVSWNMKQILIRRGINPSKISIVRQPCDLRLFNPSLYNKEAIRKKLHLEENTPLLVYVGVLESFRRGLEILIHAIARLRLNYPKIKLLLVGGGPGEEKLKNMTKSLNLNSNVLFTGWVKPESVPVYLKAADFLVIPFLKTPDIDIAAPHKVYEYMAMQKPLIVTATNEMRYMLYPDSAVFVEPGNHNELANAISHLYENPLLASKIAKNARITLERNFTWNKSIKILKRMYSKIMR